jgi:hypothetical protein
MKRYLVLVFILLASIITAQDIQMMNGTVNQCSGVFTDSGGIAGSYGDNESFTLTICPDAAGDLIQLDFTSFSTQTNADIIEFF